MERKKSFEWGTIAFLMLLFYFMVFPSKSSTLTAPMQIVTINNTSAVQNEIKNTDDHIVNIVKTTAEASVAVEAMLKCISD